MRDGTELAAVKQAMRLWRDAPPMKRTEARNIRDQVLAEAHQAGHPVHDLAHITGLHPDTILRAVHNGRLLTAFDRKQPINR